MFRSLVSAWYFMFQGADGSLGETGIDGDDGAKGPKGDIGAPGVRGSPGQAVRFLKRCTTVKSRIKKH